MLLCPPPGQHPATKIPRDTVDSSVTVLPMAQATCKKGIYRNEYHNLMQLMPSKNMKLSIH